MIKIPDITTKVQTYGSIPVLLILVALTIYTIKIKRFKRFEASILVLMFLKYIIHAFFVVAAESGLFTNHYIFFVYLSLRLTLGPICHWIYASQYSKTFWLTKGIIKEACLLSYKHHKLTENSSLR